MSCAPAHIGFAGIGGLLMKKQNPLLKPEEVADTLRIKRKTVVTMAREGRIPSVRMGRFYRFDPDEIVRWIAQNRND